MSLAAEHGRVTRTRISDDALHQAGLADAGFPLDRQRRRPPLAELADCGRSHGEFGLPPHEPLRRGHPQSLPHAPSFPQRQRQRPAEGSLSQFVSHSPPSATVLRWSRASCLRSSRTVADAGERWPALLEACWGQPLRSSNLLSSANSPVRVPYSRCSVSSRRRAWFSASSPRSGSVMTDSGKPWLSSSAQWVSRKRAAGSSVRKNSATIPLRRLAAAI